jgi:hypothetical protein
MSLQQETRVDGDGDSASRVLFGPRPIGIRRTESASNCVQNYEFYGSFSGMKASKANYTGFMERAMGIEPTSEAWEASILPLYDARSFRQLADYT